jgi:alpha-ribazole phosphatase
LGAGKNPKSKFQGGFISTRFILIRHGETDWNKDDRFRGRSDIPLNERGRAQSEQISRVLANEKIAAVYSSPLPRAMQTAEPLAQKLGLSVQARADLLDIDYGAWEGMPRDEIQAKFHDLYEVWLKAPGRVRFPGGESTRQVRNRVENLLRELSEDHLGETVALVSHRVTCHVILCYALGLSNDAIWRIRQDVGCINQIEARDEHFVVTLMNDTAHLKT